VTEECTVDVGRDFSRTPGGRYRREGRWSGEEFRDDILMPRLQKCDVVRVNLDSADGFTTSFLEEVFGGLVRTLGQEAFRRVVPVAEAIPSRAQKALAFMNRARLG
jgi:hypothetical protein